MALTIVQKPLYKLLSAGQKIIFAVSDPVIVAAETRVKYKAEVVLYDDAGTISPLAATLKTTPNDAGSGIFDLRPIVESYVSSDNLATEQNIGTSTSSSFKGNQLGTYNKFPIHIQDRYSLGKNSTKFLAVYFYVEYLDTTTNTIIDSGQLVYEFQYLIYNGVLFPNDELQTGNIATLTNDFGYDLDAFKYIQNSVSSKFLTDCPTTLNARTVDYGTFAMFNQLNPASYSFETSPNSLPASNNRIKKIELKMYDSSGSQLGSTQDIENDEGNAGGTGTIGTQFANTKLIFFGAYPANLRGWNTAFQSNLSQISYYTLQAFDRFLPVTQLYTINIICDSSFGYETIRLTWLNKHGAWDYFTFTMKNTRSVTTNRTTYTQLGGTWNEVTYKPYSYKGGMKNFNTNAKERLQLNTDFLSDLDSIWLEQLFTSPEVYIIKDFDANDTGSGNTSKINKYVEPVLITSSSYTRKTRANDKLIQYTIEIERNKNNRLQLG